MTNREKLATMSNNAMMDEVYENLVTISFAIEISAIIIWVIDEVIL